MRVPHTVDMQAVDVTRSSAVARRRRRERLQLELSDEKSGRDEEETQGSVLFTNERGDEFFGFDVGTSESTQMTTHSRSERGLRTRLRWILAALTKKSCYLAPAVVGESIREYIDL